MAKKSPKKTTRTGKLAGKTVALVGKFGYLPWLREEYENRVKRAGATLVDPEKANPDYLLVGEGRGGKPPALVAKVEKRHPAVEVLDEAGLARLLTPTADELRAEIAVGQMDQDRWGDLRESLANLRRPLDLSGADFRGVKLSEADFEHVVLTGCDFRGANLSHANLSQDRVLKAATLDDANLTEASVHRTEDCRFRGANLREASLDDGRHVRADFRRADLSQASLEESEFAECTFREACLADARLEKARLAGADLIGADLSRAHAERAKFDKADLTGATLRRADLRKASLKGADLSRADLLNAVLTGADLTGAKVDGADFAGAALAGATLKGVDTSRAKNFTPPVARAPGPALKALAQVAAAAKSLYLTAEVDLGGGDHADLIVSAHRSGNRPQVSARSEFSRDDDDGTDYVTDYIDAPSLPRAMLNLAERWPGATLRLDTVTVKATGQGRGKDLPAMALAAWSEAFGVEAASTEDVLKAKESQEATLRELRATMRAELCGGPAGVKKWNARPKRDREQIGPLAGLDLSGAKLAGLVAESADLSGSRFDGANLKGARLGRANLDGASFGRANLDGADLDLSGCAGCSFAGATLKKARLVTATLTGANLRGADLTGASLESALLEGADLTGARIDGVNWDGANYNGLTKFPAGFTPTEDMRRTKDPPPPPGAVVAVAPGSLDFPTFVERLAGRIDPGRMANAKKMLKAERFQLFSEVKPDSLTGIVRSQSEKDRVYACRLAADGTFGCGTQNLKPCGGLQGAVCKHLLVLVLGLAKAGRVDAATMDGWVEASRSKKPVMDKDAMSDLFLKYKGAEAGDIDWRPTETIPEDFYAV